MIKVKNLNQRIKTNKLRVININLDFTDPFRVQKMHLVFLLNLKLCPQSINCRENKWFYKLSNKQKLLKIKE